MLSLLGGGTANAGMPGGTGGDRLDARSDAFHTKAGQKLTVSGQGVLRNDSGRPVTLVSHTAPAHGSLELTQDGSFSYTPAAGFSGPGSSNEYNAAPPRSFMPTHACTTSPGQTNQSLRVGVGRSVPPYV